MKVTTYTNAGAFLERTQMALEAHEYDEHHFLRVG